MSWRKLQSVDDCREAIDCDWWDDVIMKEAFVFSPAESIAGGDFVNDAPQSMRILFISFDSKDRAGIELWFEEVELARIPINISLDPHVEFRNQRVEWYATTTPDASPTIVARHCWYRWYAREELDLIWRAGPHPRRPQ